MRTQTYLNGFKWIMKMLSKYIKWITKSYSRFRKNITISIVQNSLSTSDSDLKQIIEKLISEHLHHHDFNVARLSELVGFSNRHLHRKCIDLFKLPPSTLLLQSRIYYSISVLAQNNSIKVAALDSGFKSSSHFTQSFKKILGQLPSEYVKGLK
ncbi:hypothetical protein A9Q74_04795 [Colwellia sp. 39_35_sub15_T18]|nr:hypothetical protein A9Q74_04795 [Colwellia sp. 39_35_sub15_T18]